MALADNKRIAVSFLETLHEGPDRSLLAADASWWTPANGCMSLDETFANANRFRALMKEPSRMTIHTVTAEDDRVAIECRGRGLRKDGTVYANTYHFLIVVREGRITSVHEHADTAYAARVFSELLT